MTSLLPPPNATGTCDRRMSRAARQLLLDHFVPLLDHWLHQQEGDVNQLHPIPKYSSSYQLHGKPASPSTHLWDTLERTASPSCPLLRDRYRLWDDHYSLELPPRSTQLAPRRTYKRWYSCTLCGKVFCSRYYLDRHQHLQHSAGVLPTTNDSLLSSSSSSLDVCLEHVICGSLGGCEEVAFKQEPFYGRGSGGGGPDAIHVQRAWAALIPPCQQDWVIRTLKPACQSLVEECFAPIGLKNLLQDSLCHPLSCHSLFHRQELIHQLWIKYTTKHPGHPALTTVAFVIGLLGLFYIFQYFCVRERGSNGGLIVRDRKLIHKNKRNCGLTGFSSKTKKKVL